MIKIIIADDHKLMRDGIRSLLEKEPDMEIIGEAADGQEALKLVRQGLPDVLILDISMPGLNGIEAAYRINAEFPQIKLIALSVHSESRFISKMFQAGASGYLLKKCAYQELAYAIHAVISSHTYLSPLISDVVLKDYVLHSDSTDQLAASSLTSREREVLQLLAEGKNTAEIASRLDVSKKTIDTHRQHIMSKLKLKNMVELTRFAIREGLTSLES